MIGSKRALLRAMAAICIAPLIEGSPRHAVAQASKPQGKTAMKIYLAGPLGFSDAGRAFHNNVIVDRVTSLGHVPLDPWSDAAPPGIDPRLAAEIVQLASAIANVGSSPDTRAAWRALNPRIGAKNAALIDAADMVLAVLDGTDVDSGTAAEIGYAFAKGKPIHGYRGDFRLSADNEGSTVNLQVEYFITASGGKIFTSVPGRPGIFDIGRRQEFAEAIERTGAAARGRTRP
jgi:nucleoside 2-deoxyribosyltransferase